MQPRNFLLVDEVTFPSYANRAKNIKNQPRINEDPKDALLRKFQEEIERLKGQLGGKGKGGRRSRRRRNADGTEEYDDGDGDQEDEELYVKEQQDKLNDEKRAIQQKKNINGLHSCFFRFQEVFPFVF